MYNSVNHMITTEVEIKRRKDNTQHCQGWSGKALFRNSAFCKEHVFLSRFKKKQGNIFFHLMQIFLPQKFSLKTHNIVQLTLEQHEGWGTDLPHSQTSQFNFVLSTLYPWFYTHRFNQPSIVQYYSMYFMKSKIHV